jgi:hypothetical protein
MILNDVEAFMAFGDIPRGTVENTIENHYSCPPSSHKSSNYYTYLMLKKKLWGKEKTTEFTWQAIAIFTFF